MAASSRKRERASEQDDVTKNADTKENQSNGILEKVWQQHLILIGSSYHDCIRVLFRFS